MENKYEQNEKKKSNNRRANRILYIAVAAVICAGAIICGVLLARGGDEPVAPEDPAVSAPDDQPVDVTPVDPTTVLPEFAAPAVGLVTKGHDLDALVYCLTTDDWRVHCGIDICAAAGDPVMAAADGVVSAVEDDPMMGKTVRISHNGGAVTVYRNLSPELAEGLTAGTQVHCGQTIGCIGESALTELADEPHLHFEMTVGGKTVDPMDYISDASQAASLSQDTSYEG